MNATADPNRPVGPTADPPVRVLPNKSIICSRFFEGQPCDLGSECPYTHFARGTEQPIPEEVCTDYLDDVCVKDGCGKFHATAIQHRWLLAAARIHHINTYLPEDYMLVRPPVMSLSSINEHLLGNMARSSTRNANANSNAQHWHYGNNTNVQLLQQQQQQQQMQPQQQQMGMMTNGFQDVNGGGMAPGSREPVRDPNEVSREIQDAIARASRLAAGNANQAGASPPMMQEDTQTWQQQQQPPPQGGNWMNGNGAQQPMQPPPQQPMQQPPQDTPPQQNAEPWMQEALQRANRLASN